MGLSGETSGARWSRRRFGRIFSQLLDLPGVLSGFIANLLERTGDFRAGHLWGGEFRFILQSLQVISDLFLGSSKSGPGILFIFRKLALSAGKIFKFFR